MHVSKQHTVVFVSCMYISINMHMCMYMIHSRLQTNVDVLLHANLRAHAQLHALSHVHSKSTHKPIYMCFRFTIIICTCRSHIHIYLHIYIQLVHLSLILTPTKTLLCTSLCCNPGTTTRPCGSRRRARSARCCV